MSKPPTPEQIKEEIQALRNLKHRVRPTSMFGDNNRDAIEMQIRVLEEDLDEEALYAMQDEDEITEHECGNGLDAVNWLNGEHESDTLSEDWAPLAK